MREDFESEVKKNKEKSETDIQLRHLNSRLLDELSVLSYKQLSKLWFDLTQKHLRDYKDGKLTEEEFRSEELEFIFLNRLSEKHIPSLNPEMHQRGFYFNPEMQSGKRMEKFSNFGDFITVVQNEAENHIKEDLESFQILVGGIGISGKATLRSVISKELNDRLPRKKIISWDRDYQKLFPIPIEWKGDINIIEDVHGLDNERDENGKLKRFNGTEGLTKGYNMVVYVLPVADTFRQNLIKRGVGWLQAGKLDLTATGKKQYSDNQEQKIEQTANELERVLSEAKEWFREQLKVLKELKNNGVKIVVIEPSEILKSLYNFEEKSELVDKSFSEALKMLLEK